MFSDKLFHVPESSGNYQLNGGGYFCLKPYQAGSQHDITSRGKWLSEEEMSSGGIKIKKE